MEGLTGHLQKITERIELLQEYNSLKLGPNWDADFKKFCANRTSTSNDMNNFLESIGLDANTNNSSTRKRKSTQQSPDVEKHSSDRSADRRSVDSDDIDEVTNHSATRRPRRFKRAGKKVEKEEEKEDVPEIEKSPEIVINLDDEEPQEVNEREEEEEEDKDEPVVTKDKKKVTEKNGFRTSDRAYKCSNCTSSYQRLSHLSLHVRNKCCWKNPLYPNIKCDSCDKMFQNKGAYISHYKSHTREKDSGKASKSKQKQPKKVSPADESPSLSVSTPDADSSSSDVNGSPN